MVDAVLTSPEKHFYHHIPFLMRWVITANNSTEQQNISCKSTSKVPFVNWSPLFNKEQVTWPASREPANPATLSYKTARSVVAWFSEGTKTITVGLVAACATVCPSVSGSTSLLLWGATHLWVLVHLSSLPVTVVTAYDRGTPASFSFTSAGFHFSVVWSWMVLVPEVALQTHHGCIFGAPASPLVWGQLLRSRYLLGFSSGGCPGSLDLEVIQQVMAICVQWVWFSGTGGPCQGLLGWFLLWEEQL